MSPILRSIQRRLQVVQDLLSGRVTGPIPDPPVCPCLIEWSLRRLGVIAAGSGYTQEGAAAARVRKEFEKSENGETAEATAANRSKIIPKGRNSSPPAMVCWKAKRAALAGLPSVRSDCPSSVHAGEAQWLSRRVASSAAIRAPSASASRSPVCVSRWVTTDAALTAAAMAASSTDAFAAM